MVEMVMEKTMVMTKRCHKSTVLVVPGQDSSHSSLTVELLKCDSLEASCSRCMCVW